MNMITKSLLSALLITTACTYAADKQIIPNGVAPMELDAKQQAELDYKLAEAVCASGDKDLDIAEVESILNQKANPNALRKDTGIRCLFIAANNKPLTAQLLLAHKADPNAENACYDPGLMHDWQKATALMKAALSNCPETVQLLVASKAKVNAQDANGSTALHWALNNPNQATNKILDLLLSGKADCNIAANDGYTPLRTAVKCKNQEALLLLNAKANPDKGFDSYGFNPLLSALCDRYNRDKIFLLLKAKADCNATALLGNTAHTPLSLSQTHQGGQGEHEDVVIALLQAGAKNTSDTPLLSFLNPTNKPHQRPAEDTCAQIAADIVKSVCKTGTNGNVFNQLGARELGKPIRSDLLRYKYSDTSKDKKNEDKKN